MRDAVLASLERMSLGRDVLERPAEIAVQEGYAGAAGRRRAREGLCHRGGALENRRMGNLRKALGGAESDGERLFLAYEYLAEPFPRRGLPESDGT
jgi:hypothetical protein